MSIQEKNEKGKELIGKYENVVSNDWWNED